MRFWRKIFKPKMQIFGEPTGTKYRVVIMRNGIIFRGTLSIVDQYGYGITLDLKSNRRGAENYKRKQVTVIRDHYKAGQEIKDLQGSLIGALVSFSKLEA